MMKNFNKLVLICLCAMSNALHAAQPPVLPPVDYNLPAQLIAEYTAAHNIGFAEGVKEGIKVASPNSNGTPNNSNAATTGNFWIDGAYKGMVELIGGTLILGAGAYIAKKIGNYIAGETDDEKIKNELANLTAEQTLLDNQGAGLFREWNTQREIFNGANNLKTDKKEVEALKKEIQTQIDRLWQAIKDNNAEKEALALKIKGYRNQLITKGKYTAAALPATTPQQLLNGPSAPLPVLTVQATPEMAARALAASAARRGA